MSKLSDFLPNNWEAKFVMPIIACTGDDWIFGPGNNILLFLLTFVLVLELNHKNFTFLLKGECI
jgi:hypothetical protein